MNEHSNDDALLAAMREGDHRAFLLLYKRYGRSIFSFLYRLLGSEKAAEDILHDCFLDLVRNANHLHLSQTPVLTQLYVKARELALQYLDQMTTTDYLTQTQHKEGQEAQSLVNGELVKQAISGLPLLEREALILFEYEHLSLSEIAEIVGVDENTVGARLHEARLNLRNRLSRYLA